MDPPPGSHEFAEQVSAGLQAMKGSFCGGRSASELGLHLGWLETSVQCCVVPCRPHFETDLPRATGNGETKDAHTEKQALNGPWVLRAMSLQVGNLVCLLNTSEQGGRFVVHN